MIGEGELSLYYYPDQEKKDFEEALLELCMQDAREEGLKIGRAEGRDLKKIEMIISLNELHVPLDIIAKSAKTSIKKVKQIINEHKK